MQHPSSTYQHDKRVQPFHHGWWQVDNPHWDIVVVEGDDGLWTAFAVEPARGGGHRLGQQASVPRGTFDTVVHHLIGDPA